MENTKLFSVHDLQSVATEDSVDFAIARIAVLSTAPNSHGINITEEILRRDTPSILGKFVVADYQKWRGDVTTHVPTEFIQGYIPTDQEVQFVRNDDGYLVAYVDAVISKLYATDVYNLFVEDNFRNASVEMATENDREMPNGTIDIDGLHIFGITILGKEINGSCPDANIQIVQFSEQKATDYYTKEKALKLSDELRKFAESLDKNKDDINNDVKETKMADVKELAEQKTEEETDVVMSAEENKELAEPNKSEEESKDDKKDMAETQSTEMSEDANKEVAKDEEKDKNAEDKSDDKLKEDEKDMAKEPNEDEKDMSCGGEKEFAISEFASKELIDSLDNEKVKEFVGMSADDMIKAFAEIVKENAELKDYKEKVLMAQKDEKVKLVLASVKLDIDEEHYKAFEEESKELKLEDVDAFANRVKAFAYENAKTKEVKPQDNEVFTFGGVDNTKVESEDVFVRLANK